MKRLLIIGFALIVLTACAGMTGSDEVVTGSETLVSRSFAVDGFSRIDANNTAQVEMTRVGSYSVEVEVNDNLADLLDVSVRGDTLRIQLQDGSYKNVTLRARVTMPELTGVTLDGASRLRGELGGEDLAANLNGSSQATLTGTAGRVEIDINGGSRALFGQLAAGDVELKADGGSNVEIQATGTVSGQANGGATVTVSGSPTAVDVETDGGATVKSK